MTTQTSQITLPRMRTIKEAVAEIKALDSNTAVTVYHIRQQVLSGAIPCVNVGNKRLVNLDTVIEYLQNPSADKFRPKAHAECSGINGIRRIR